LPLPGFEPSYRCSSISIIEILYCYL
jgi:hypothetical protein